MKPSTLSRTPILASRSQAAHRRARPSLVALASLLLAACTTVGPDYREPPVPVGNGWSQAQPAGESAVELARWWAALGDPVLERLVETALTRNLELRQALARIDEARALRERTAGAAAPRVGVGATVGRQRLSENGLLPVGRIPGLEADQTLHDAGFDASWELDLFGGQRRAQESADARAAAAQLDAQGVCMRVAAEVARNWFTLLGATQELHAQQAGIESLHQTLALLRQRHVAGDVGASELDATAALAAAAQASLPAIEARRRASALALGLLLGGVPEQELALLQDTPELRTLAAFPVGERAELLRRRPDVRAAERRLAASTAEIGVATAELFPKLSISAGGGLQALATGDWFDASSARWAVLPLISWRLFDGGRVRAEIRAREAGQQQAALAYEQAVLAALGDAERALGDYRAGLETLSGRRAAEEASRRALEHARARLAAGNIARTELLAAERLLLEARAASARAHGAAAVQMVALYKALGGGWDGAHAPGQSAPAGPAVAAVRARSPQAGTAQTGGHAFGSVASSPGD